jgi:hypothetical protein
MSIIQLLEKKEHFHKGKPVEIEQIRRAEVELGVEFSMEYLEYLQYFGVVSANGHEYTGLGLSNRLDVVQVSKRIRQEQNVKELDMYVIEEANIDGIVIWQKTDGSVYLTQDDGVAEKIFNSFEQYLENQN